MVVSILIRHTRLTERAAWEDALGSVLQRIRDVLAEESGFVSVEYLWGADEPGKIAQITTWQSGDDCLSYIRNGGAATVATIEDAAVPTAAHPEGNWVRQNFAVAVPA